jgi:superfamily I DNA/RNA helicase
MVANNKQRLLKEPFSAKQSSDKNPAFFEYDDMEKMAHDFAQNMLERKKSGVEYKDMCVLYRSNRLAQFFETALLSYGIPYHVIKGTNLTQKREIQMLNAIIRLVLNKRDFLAFVKLAELVDGLGIGALKKIEDALLENELTTVFDVAEVVIKSKKALEGIHNLKEKIEQVSQLEPFMIGEWMLHEKGLNITPYLLKLAESSKKSDENYQQRLEAIMNYGQALNFRLEEAGETMDLSLEEKWVLAMEMSLSSPDEEASKNAVTLSTIHKSKGLEWNSVYLGGFSLFNQDIEDEDDASVKGLEEERRLAYVAMTRAKEYLLLGHSDKINFGYSVIEAQKSPFAKEAGINGVKKKVYIQRNLYQNTSKSDALGQLGVNHSH